MTKWSEAAKASAAAKRGTMSNRMELIAAMYTAGYTLQQIGDQFGITRERVRQLLRKHTSITKIDGGQALKTRHKREARQNKMMRAGCTFAQWKHLLAIGKEMMDGGAGAYRTPTRAYASQRQNAKIRGIEWNLTLWQWWTIWQESGKWERRGRGQGYAMCRHGDVGPYSVDNVFIGTSRENSSRPDSKKSGLPIGVVKTTQGKFAAWRCVSGKKKWLGQYATPELAHAAYLASLAPEARAA